MNKRTKKLQKIDSRRSACPIACALDIMGDRWTMLVIRDLLHGFSRFKEIASSPERPPTNILTERLNRLVLHGIVKRTAHEGTKHLAYKLTDKGEALIPVLKSLRDWGLLWIGGTEVRISPK